jgi:hypothetical protein
MKKMRWYGAALTAAVVCGLAGAGSALGSANTLRGNAQGMKVAERIMHAFAKLPGYTYTETKFFQMTTKGGTSPALHYRFGYSSLPSGWSWASEKGAMRLSNNHIVWWRDDLTPASNHAQPVEIVFNGNGKFWAFGNVHHHGCFRPLASSSQMPFTDGYVVTGKVNGPKNGSLSYVYDWGGPSARAHETDNYDGSSYLVRSGVVAVGGYSFGFANNFGGPGPAPDVHQCRD